MDLVPEVKQNQLTGVGCTRLSLLLLPYLKSSYEFFSLKLLQFGFPQAVLRNAEKDEITKYQKSSSKHVIQVLQF